MAQDFPTTAGAITPQWLTGVLLAGGWLGQGARVSALTTAGVGEQGQTGEVSLLKLSFEGDPGETPAVMVAKVPPPYEEIRQQMHMLGLYEREVRFYKEIGADAGISVPRCYHAQVDTASGDFILLLEDMSACREGNFWQSSIDDVRVAIDGLADMHARWWCSPKLRDFAWLRQHDDVDYNQTLLGATLRAVLPMTEQRFPEKFTGYLRDTARSLVANWESYAAYREGEAFSLGHGDFHPKQLFFAGEQGGRFAVFDWQTVCSTRPGVDVGRIFLTGLSPADMREHQAALLRRYLDRLASHGVEYGMEALADDVRKGMLYTLGVTIFAMATTDVTILENAARERGCDFQVRVFDDLSEALKDNRAHEVLG